MFSVDDWEDSNIKYFYSLTNVKKIIKQGEHKKINKSKSFILTKNKKKKRIYGQKRKVELLQKMVCT